VNETNIINIHTAVSGATFGRVVVPLLLNVRDVMYRTKITSFLESEQFADNKERNRNVRSWLCYVMAEGGGETYW